MCPDINQSANFERAANIPAMAELDYGKEKMDRYRGSPDRVREPHPTLELRPDGVGDWRTALVARFPGS